MSDGQTGTESKGVELQHAQAPIEPGLERIHLGQFLSECGKSTCGEEHDVCAQGFCIRDDGRT